MGNLDHLTWAGLRRLKTKLEARVALLGDNIMNGNDLPPGPRKVRWTEIKLKVVEIEGTILELETKSAEALTIKKMDFYINKRLRLIEKRDNMNLRADKVVGRHNHPINVLKARIEEIDSKLPAGID